MSNRDYGEGGQKLAGNEQIANEVAANEDGIGYVGLAFAGKDGLRAVKVDGVTPKPRNLEQYPLARRLHFYTAGKPSGDTRKFLDWSLESEVASKIITKVGFIPVD
jgi:phosphate transport system substrate-binding protein